MPHIELKYTDDLNLDTNKVFSALENTIKSLDSNVGPFIHRGYPCSTYNNSHLQVKIYLLDKEHRDQMYCDNLLSALSAELTPLLKKPCSAFIEFDFRSPNYNSIQIKV